ncbi:unnamed protein product, partial [Ixodes hexagonus]
DQLCYREGGFSGDEIQAMTRIKQAGTREMNSGTEINIAEIVNREVTDRTLADALITKFPTFVMCVMRESQMLQEGNPRPSTTA